MILAIVNGNRLINVQECLLSPSHTPDSTLWHRIVGEELKEVLVPPNLHFSSKKNQKRAGEHEKLETETQEGLETELKPLWEESYQSRM